jgi:hypothetical protein
VEEKVCWEEEIVGTKPYLAYRVVPKDKRDDAKNEETCCEEDLQREEAKMTSLTLSNTSSLAIGNKRTFEITFVDTGLSHPFKSKGDSFNFRNLSWHSQEVNTSV